MSEIEKAWKEIPEPIFIEVCGSVYAVITPLGRLYIPIVPGATVDAENINECKGRKRVSKEELAVFMMLYYEAVQGRRIFAALPPEKAVEETVKRGIYVIPELILR
jgi:hypothetical protein